MTDEEYRQLNSIAVQRFGTQWPMLTDEEAEEVLRERERERSQPYFAGEMDGYFADRQGFHDPAKAAAHAMIIQGGFSTPLREAARMIKDGGVSAERARAWMTKFGYTDNDLEDS